MVTAVRRTLVCSLLAGCLAVVGGGAQAAVPAQVDVSAASITLAGVPVWAHFTNPSSGRDYTIITELLAP